MKKIFLLFILFPLVNFAQIDVLQGPKIHRIDSVSIDYNQNPTEVYIQEYNVFYRDIKNIIIEELGQDTLAINLFYIDCYSYYASSKTNDTIVESPQSINTPFNLIIRTYLDTNRVISNCYYRDFYTLTDSVFISKEDNHYSSLSLEELNNEGQEINIYPNPAKDKLFIKQGASVKPSRFEIINSQGAVMLKGNVEKFIDISSLDQGIYFIRFEEKGSAVIKRFVVS